MAIEIEVEQIEQEDTREETQFNSEGACKIVVLDVQRLGVVIDFDGLNKSFNVERGFSLNSGDPKEELEFTGVISLTPNNPLTKNKSITILRFKETNP